MINYKGTIVRVVVTNARDIHDTDWYYTWGVELEDSKQIFNLHPDDVNQIDELSKVFDNIEARILKNPKVEFNMVSAITTDRSGLSTIRHYAKLVQNLSLPMVDDDVEEEYVYTRSEVATLLEEYRTYAFLNGLSPSKLEQWFEENV